MEASGRSYQDAICGAFVAALCYMKAKHHQQQQQQQQQHEKQEHPDQKFESPQETSSSSPSSCPSYSVTSSKSSSVVTSPPSRAPSVVTSPPSRAPSVIASPPSRSPSVITSTHSGTYRTKQKPIFEAEPLSTDWTQLEVIDLINDGTGLGFGIIGGRSTGVVVKTLLPGGIADMDGHLRTGDHILQIGDVSVRGMSSEQVALVLRQSGPHVRLVVARSVLEPPQFQIPHAPIIPTHQLEQHMEHFNAVMAMEAGEHELHLHNLHLQHQMQQYHYQQQQAMMSSVQVHPQPIEMMEEMSDVSDVDVFEVNLVKDSGGLGITIAGYVGRDNTPDEISGIFVKSIAEGSAADIDGRVHVNDQIIEVDSTSLQGFSNQQAVEVLRNTGQMVKLKLVRFNHGLKYDKLQEYLAQANQYAAVQPSPAKEAVSVYNFTSEQADLCEIPNLMDDFSGMLTPEVEAALRSSWEPIVGNDFLVVVAQLAKFKEAGGLGISLEGTVDVEDGIEVRPHHYIRSILPDGPVGLNGRLKSGDELLEVNGKRLLGLNHINVVDILKDLPLHVRLVCARRKTPLPDCFTLPNMPIPGSLPYLLGVAACTFARERLVKAKSEIALSAPEPAIRGCLSKSKSRSLEPILGLAMWSSQPVVIALEKGDKGLGFSILEYQDPANHNESVIVIRSLVPGGVAQLDGRLVPGDRLMFVNDVNLEHATQVQAVQALKQAKRGMVKIGVAKPLPLAEIFKQKSQLPIVSTISPCTDPLPAAKVTLSHSGPSCRHELQESPVHLHLESDPSLSDDSTKSTQLEQPVKDISAPALIHEDSNLEIQSENSADFLDDKCLDSSPSVNSLRYSLIPYDSSRFDAITPDKPQGPENHQQKFSKTADVQRHDTDLIPGAKVNRHELPNSKQTAPDTATHGEETNANLLALLLTKKSTEQSQEVSNANILLNLAAPIAKLDSTEFESEKPKDVATTLQDQDSPSNLLIYAQKKRLQQIGLFQETPLPLPAISSPPITRAQTPPLTPPLRPAPCSPKRFDIDSKIHGRSASLHRKATSSPSTEQVTTSNLKTPPSPLRSLNSGITSPELTRLYAGLERTIHINKANLHLGLTVETVDKNINGCIVKNIAKPSAVDQDGRIQTGDYILSINNESLRRITNAQARAILRRSSLLGSDVNITYIPGPSLNKQIQMTVSDSKLAQSPPDVLKLSSSLKAEECVQTTQQLQALTPSEALSDRQTDPAVSQNSCHSNGSSVISGQFWGPPRVVQLTREPGKSLGISIVGGRVETFSEGQEQSCVGIYIKHVLADSPAGRDGTLKKGDHVLEVNGCDVRNATHDEAVEAIRSSSSKITFVVQSLSRSCYYSDIETSQVKPVLLSQDSALQLENSITLSNGRSTQEDLQEADMKVAESVSDNESEDEFGYSKKSLERKYLDQAGIVQLVDLQCSNGRLGLELAGNKDRSKMSTFVAGIQPGSPAALDGRIQAGDELLEINGINLHGLSHLNASAVIKGNIIPIVKLVIHRRDDFLDHIAVKPSHYSICRQFGALPIFSRGSGDTDTASSGNSRCESSATSYSPSPSTNALVTSPTSVQSLVQEESVQVIALHKPNSQGLGFGIHEVYQNGRHGIYVKSITEGGIADKDHRLEVGDEILEVGDKSLMDLHYDKALDVLRAAQGTVHLKVQKVSSSSRLIFTTAISENSHVKLKQQNTAGSSSTDPADSDKSDDPRTCPIALGKCTYIEIEKSKKGLGLSIVGGSDTQLGAIVIHELYKEGTAAKEGRLRVGDQILEVNGENLRDTTHAHALQVLRQSPSVVKMTVYRKENWVEDDDILDVLSVDLMRRPGRGLGFSIMGRKNGKGIFISDIVKGGVAEADGRLMYGDRILSVNGDDMRNSAYDYAAAVLKTIMGKVNLSIGRLKASSKISSRKSSNHSTSLKKSDSSASSRSKCRNLKNVSDTPSHQKVIEETKAGSQKICLDSELRSPAKYTPTTTVSKMEEECGVIAENVMSGEERFVAHRNVTKPHKEVVDTVRSSKVKTNAGQEESTFVPGQSLKLTNTVTETVIEFTEDIITVLQINDSNQFPQHGKVTLKTQPGVLGCSSNDDELSCENGDTHL